MQFSSVLLAGFVALASAQTYTGPTVSPTAAAPSGCATTAPGTYELSVANITTGAASKVKRQAVAASNALLISLDNGILKDNKGRIGYIASNYQFQFDFGGQAGEIYSAGWSKCSNGTLALGGSAIFYECLSGDFYNLYDRHWAPQCMPVYLDLIAATASGSNTFSSVPATTSTSAAAASSAPAASSVSVSVATSVAVSTSSAAALSSIPDGQPQAPTSTSQVLVSSTIMSTSTITPSPVVSTSSAAIVSSISDHQIQAPTSTSLEVYTGAAAMPTAAAQLLLAAAGAAIALF